MVVNLQVYTTQADQQPAIRLLQEVVNNGSIITVCSLRVPYTAGCILPQHLVLRSFERF